MSQDVRQAAFAPVRAELNFPADEERTLAFWKAHGIFEKTLQADTRATGASRGRFVFYEGPPTANGMPHNGHVLTRAVKDVVPRYKTMCGYDVPRKAGWDTHGLPVEVEVEKTLGIHGKADIEAYGIKPFIARCIASVFRYTEVWERNTEKLGYWVDLEEAYVTFHKNYVQSVWWALSQLHKKGLLYRGHRVCWWWPQGGTALSAAEVGWNYKTVDDPSCYVALPLVDEPEVALCVWTTTPWTLPSNGYAAVRNDFDYCEVSWRDGKRLIVAAQLRAALAAKLAKAHRGAGSAPTLDIVRTFKGSALVGKRYRPCFDYYVDEMFDRVVPLKEGGSAAMYWRVLAQDFVTLDSGTGIVHIAPAFGEDDNNAHKAQLRSYAVAAEDVPLLCAVAPDGTLTERAGPFAGKWVKDADPLLLDDLRARGLLVHDEKYRHEYPYCWRADDDPLIQLARPAWYIRTSERIADAIANNQHVSWLPGHIKDGRFGDFLQNNVDWALSRERFWGTPLNVWVCGDCGHELAPESVAAIEALNPDAFAHFHQAKRDDPELNEHLMVHKPWIDEVTLPCPKCDANMKRVTEVIDAWFDSGSMPFAQHGFPHQPGSLERFKAAWPADFISEAIDQTRGWFYSLLMVSTLVFDEVTCKQVKLAAPQFPHPYRACVVLGHVCDRDGKKESKSKGNYTPPDIIIERVRLEFAPLAADDEALGKLRDKLQLRDGVAYIAREDYDGLDLAGESAQVVAYRGDRTGQTKNLELRPLKGLPRRLVLLTAADRAALGLTLATAGLKTKPVSVPTLPQAQRVQLEDPSRPAPGADAFRWFFYAASPPWTNTRHSLSNVRLAQKEFLIKLRNVYSFFVIYANIDGFSPALDNPAATDTSVADLAKSRGYRPPEQRGRLDRWICSEASLAVMEVATKLNAYDLYSAAQRLVDLVDALSNWYVRRSRARFWAPADAAEQQRDKTDASYTLYEVLVTITKAIAPFVPFFAEELYQNLVRKPWPHSQPESVHLCGYPQPHPPVVDEELAADMRAVRELVSLGLQVRTGNKLRVRQPLRRADVVIADAAQRQRLKAYEALIVEELNVHQLRWLTPGEEGQAVSYQLKPNFRALGPRLGKGVQAVKKALAVADAGALRSELALHGEVKLEVDGQTLTLNGEEVRVLVVASDGYAAAGGRAGVVVLHTALDAALLDEGLAREVLSKVQSLRKQLDLGYTQRIVLSLRGGERVRRVVNAQRQHIAREALCDQIVLAPAADEPPTGDGWELANMQGETVFVRVVVSS